MTVSSACYTYASWNSGFLICFMRVHSVRAYAYKFLYRVAITTYWRRAKPETFRLFDQIWHFLSILTLYSTFWQCHASYELFCSILLNVLLTREVTGKNVTGTVKVFKKDQLLQKARGYPYILWCEMEAASLFNMWLVSGCEQKVFMLYLSWTRGRLSETLKTLLQRFCYQKRTKNDFNVTICHVV